MSEGISKEELLKILSDNKKSNTNLNIDISKIIITVVAGLSIYFITSAVTDSKVDSNSISEIKIELANIKSELEGRKQGERDLKVSIDDLKGALANNRIDPFTGAMGIALERRMQEYTDKKFDRLAIKIDSFIDEHRKMHNNQ